MDKFEQQKATFLSTEYPALFSSPSPLEMFKCNSFLTAALTGSAATGLPASASSASLRCSVVLPPTRGFKERRPRAQGTQRSVRSRVLRVPQCHRDLRSSAVVQISHMAHVQHVIIKKKIFYELIDAEKGNKAHRFTAEGTEESDTHRPELLGWQQQAQFGAQQITKLLPDCMGQLSPNHMAGTTWRHTPKGVGTNPTCQLADSHRDRNRVPTCTLSLCRVTRGAKSSCSLPASKHVNLSHQNQPPSARAQLVLKQSPCGSAQPQLRGCQHRAGSSRARGCTSFSRAQCSPAPRTPALRVQMVAAISSTAVSCIAESIYLLMSTVPKTRSL